MYETRLTCCFSIPRWHWSGWMEKETFMIWNRIQPQQKHIHRALSFISCTFFHLSLYRMETNCRQCNKLNNKSRFTLSSSLTLKAFCLLNGMNRECIAMTRRGERKRETKICIIHIMLNHPLFRRELFPGTRERCMHVFNENEFD